MSTANLSTHLLTVFSSHIVDATSADEMSHCLTLSLLPTVSDEEAICGMAQAMKQHQLNGRLIHRHNLHM